MSWWPKPTSVSAFWTTIARGGKAPGAYRPWHFCAKYGLELKNGYALGPELVLRDADRAVDWSGISPQPA